MWLEINSQHPNARHIDTVVDILDRDGVVILPTDTVYAFVCKARSKKAVDKVYQLRKLTRKDARFSIICHEFSQITSLAKPLTKVTFKELKDHLPGPYTYLVQASNAVPKLIQSKRKTLGIRMLDNQVIMEVARKLDDYLLSASIKLEEDDETYYYNNPLALRDLYENQVDLIVDGGNTSGDLSSLVDLSDGTVDVLREIQPANLYLYD